ncbi:MAG: hypothetical protein IPM24_23310 [Bryobacterales bacterium]|nr:hypothetical protein [Bryobacterales bacterium]
MNLGAEPKKVVILGGLLAVAGVMFYVNLSDSGSPTPARPAPAPAAKPSVARSAVKGPIVRRAPGKRGTAGREFRYTLQIDPENTPDPTQIDPTLRLDLLARVQDTPLGSGKRSIFQFGQPPPPPAAEIKDAPKITPKTPAEIAAEAAKAAAQKIAASKPAPPPITFKFYGYSEPRENGSRGAKRAFFLDGEDIYVATEGDVIKKRYKVVRIGATSVVMEDIEHKHQQTLTLLPEQG